MTKANGTPISESARLAEWATASHVEKHTPVPRAKPAATATQK